MLDDFLFVYFGVDIDNEYLISVQYDYISIDNEGVTGLTITRTLRADPDVFKRLKDISNTEGRTLGKMLEILVKEYEKKRKKLEK